MTHIESVLISSGFLDPTNPGQSLTRLRRLFNRVQPDETEVQMLRGVLNHLAPLSLRSAASHLTSRQCSSTASSYSPVPRNPYSRALLSCLSRHIRILAGSLSVVAATRWEGGGVEAMAGGSLPPWRGVHSRPPDPISGPVF